MGPKWNRSWMSISLAADPRKGAESLRKWFLIIQLRHSIMDFDLMARGKKKDFDELIICTLKYQTGWSK